MALCTTRSPERDVERDAVLAAAGIRTLRFRNEEVLGDPVAVLRRIERELASAR
jgi:very-short-patch-repair endonuclease